MDKPEDFIEPPNASGTSEEGRMGQLTEALIALTKNVNSLVEGLAAANDIELPKEEG